MSECGNDAAAAYHWTLSESLSEMARKLQQKVMLMRIACPCPTFESGGVHVHMMGVMSIGLISHLFRILKSVLQKCKSAVTELRKIGERIRFV